MRLPEDVHAHITQQLNEVTQELVKHGDQVRRYRGLADNAQAQLNAAEWWAQCLQRQLADHDQAVADLEAKDD